MDNVSYPHYSLTSVQDNMRPIDLLAFRVDDAHK